MSDITVVGLEGISETAMQTTVNTTTGPSTLREIIRTSVPNIFSIEYTNSTTDKGKWFIILQKRNERAFHQWIQGPLRNIFKAIPSENWITGYDGPQRVGSNNSNSIVGGYAAVLLNSISTKSLPTDKYDNTMQRPQKRQIINLLDDEEYPELSQKQKTRTTAHKIAPDRTPSSIITQDTTQTNVTELLDSKIAVLKTQQQQQLTTQIQDLTNKLENHLNTQLESSIHLLEKSLTTTLDVKMNKLFQRLDNILPSMTSSTSQSTVNSSSVSSKSTLTQPLCTHTQSQGTDYPLDNTITIVGNAMTTDDVLI